jgi:succinate-semialdehyde dehydrogenase
MSFISTCPYTGEVTFQKLAWSFEYFQSVIGHIRRQQNIWQSYTLDERVARMKKLAEAIEANRSDLIRLVSLEVGRLNKEVDAEVTKSIQLIRIMTDEAPHWLRFRNVPTEASLSGIQFNPMGVIFAIMPWNFPLWQPLRFAVPALLAGNACLVKPAPSVPQLSSLLESLALDSGVSALQMAWVDTENIPYAIEHTDAVAFTGSTRVGRIIGSLAGNYLKKSILELGGSNPMIILDDADLDLAVNAAVMARFQDAGQACNSAKRFIVLPHIAQEFIERFVEKARVLKLGLPDDPSSTLAPMAKADLRDFLHGQVEDALSQGATCLLGGVHPHAPSFEYPATIIDHVHSGCRLYHEECFGPVATILRAENEQHAIFLANDSSFGLGAAVFSKDYEKARHIAQQIKTGGIYINRHMSSHIRLPFGGVKNSGYGRELGEFGFYEWVNIQSWWER